MKQSPTLVSMLVAIGMLWACATTQTVTSENITVGWDAPTSFQDGTPLTEAMEIRYMVYIDRDTDQTHDDKEKLFEDPIAETTYTIESVEHEGTYFIGIQAIAYRDKDGALHDDPMFSRIAWSSNTADTNNKPFRVRFK